jgi:hypothetical protein
MASGLDILAFEFFKVLMSPALLIVMLGALLLWIVFVGGIFSVIFKKYSFFGYPIRTLPGCGFLAAFVMALLMIVNVLIGTRPLSEGIALGIAIVVLLLAYGFVVQLKKLLNK